jgi:thiamine kinase
MDPVKIAADSLNKERDAFTFSERIKSGLTNESWLVRADDAAVVVRMSNRDTDVLQIDRQSESLILNAVARAGIGAPVVLCDLERHLLVTRFLPGHIWTARDARLSDNLRRLATLLRSLHALAIPEGAQTVDLLDTVRRYWHTLMARGLSARAGAPKVRERARQFIAELSDDAQRSLCHNDVHHLNIIDNGELRLIDWEYAGAGDPYFDLASVCCYHALSNQGRREFLTAYLGKDSAASFERLQRMCWVFNYIRDLWFAVREME